MNNKDLKIKKELEENFIDYYGMTLDEFSSLDIDTQEVLIRKVYKLRKKKFLEKEHKMENKIEKFLNILLNKKEENKVKKLKR